MKDRSPLSAGLAAALRHRRLALCLWLSLALTSGLVWAALGTALGPFDDGPFRETTLKGWDSLGMIAFIALKGREIEALLSALGTAALVSFLVHLALTGGLPRVLETDVNRPVLRRLVAESAALFRPNLWAFIRFALTLAIWEAIVVGIPVAVLEKLAGEDAPPNNALVLWGGRYTLVAGVVVFLVVRLRFDLARIALAKDDAATARGAYRVAKERLSQGRASGVLVLLGWLVAGLVIQAIFTRVGLSLNPDTGRAVFGLFLFRQIGFVLLAMTHVGYWGSLLAWEKARRPVPLPIPEWRPTPFPVQAAALAEPRAEALAPEVPALEADPAPPTESA